MGKIVLIMFGAGMAFLGTCGTYFAVTSFGKAPVVKSDVSTTGVVTDMQATELRHKIGVKLSTSYKFKYSFEAQDGKTYHGEHTLKEAEFNSLSEGKSVDVLYHSDNPNISAVPKYGHYMAVSDFPGPTPAVRLGVSLGTLFLGATIVFLGFRSVP